MAQRKKDTRSALEKLEIVPEQEEKNGNSAHRKNKLDVVLTEGKCSLPNPSSSDNYDGMQIWSPKTLNSKKMPAIDGKSPPNINAKSSSNNTASVSPGIS